MVGTASTEYTYRKKKYKEIYSRTFYEVWVKGKRIYIHKNNNKWSPYKNLVYLRDLLRKHLVYYPFEIYKVIPSKMNAMEFEVEANETPVVKMKRPPAEYSNKSAFKIASGE